MNARKAKTAYKNDIHIVTTDSDIDDLDTIAYSGERDR